MIEDTFGSCTGTSGSSRGVEPSGLAIKVMRLFRSWSAVAAVLLATSLASTGVKAESVVFAIDAALPRVELDQAESMILAIQDGLAPSVQTGLIVFDDVVQKVVSLGANDPARKTEINEVMGSIGRTNTSSMASGIERSFEALKESGSGDIFMFGRAQIDSESEEGRSRHKDWLDLVLLPDARDANIGISLFTPGAGEDETILSSLLGHSLNTHTLMQLDAELPASLTALVPGITTVEDLLGEFVIASVDSVESEAPTQQTASVAATTTTPDSSATQASSASGLISGLQGEQWLKILWAIALVSIAVLLMFLLYWLVKGRKSKQRGSDNTMSNTSSTYLPLDAEPTTGGFSAMAQRLDQDETQEDWTLPTVANEQDEFLARTLPKVDDIHGNSDAMNFQPSNSSISSHEDETVLRDNSIVSGAGFATSAETGGAAELSPELDVDETTRLRPNPTDSAVTAPQPDSTSVESDQIADATLDDFPVPDTPSLDQTQPSNVSEVTDEDRTVLRPKSEPPVANDDGFPAHDPFDDDTVPRPAVSGLKSGDSGQLFDESDTVKKDDS